jgi:hypothetical protein
VHVRPGVRREGGGCVVRLIGRPAVRDRCPASAACSLTRISVLPSWPPSIIHPTASFGAVCLIFPIPNDSGGPGGGRLWLFPVGKNLEVPHFKRVLRHLSVRPLTPSPGSLPCRGLSGVHRQRCDRRTMLPNNRRVRWLSASINQ